MNLYIIAVMIVIAIGLSVIIPGSVLDTSSDIISLVPAENGMSVSDYISSPIDSLVGINDGSTIKSSNTGSPNGAIGLVLLVLAIGSFVTVCTRVGVFDQLIGSIINSNLGIGKITTLLSLYFVLCATTFGLYESAVCYVPLLINLYKRYNVNSLFAIKVLILSVSVGYIASPINPFATMIADQIAGNSANMFVFRTVLLLVLTVTLIIYLLVCLQKFDIQKQVSSTEHDSQFKLLNFLIFLFPYVYMTVGFMPDFLFGATMSTVTISFIASGIIIGLINKLTLTETIDQLFLGSNNFLIIAVSITLARTVYIILFNSHVIDTIIYQIVNTISPFSIILIIICVALLFMVLSYIIPSPSALAMITLPIIAPALELVGISIASTVTLFLLIHGISKMYSITSPLVISSISNADISYKQYVASIRNYMVGVALAVLVVIIIIH